MTGNWVPGPCRPCGRTAHQPGRVAIDELVEPYQARDFREPSFTDSDWVVVPWPLPERRRLFRFIDHAEERLGATTPRTAAASHADGS